MWGSREALKRGGEIRNMPPSDRGVRLIANADDEMGVVCVRD